MTICDKIVIHGATGMMTTGNKVVHLYEITPVNIEQQCLSCTHYQREGTHTYCARNEHWKGYKNKYEKQQKMI